MKRISPERLKEIREHAQFGYAKQVISELLEEIDGLRTDNLELKKDIVACMSQITKKNPLETIDFPCDICRALADPDK